MRIKRDASRRERTHPTAPDRAPQGPASTIATRTDDRMMAGVKNVLIVGCGIGGLTAAVAFAKHGIHADIIEIKPEPSVYGVGIIQPGNALRALNSLGLMQACLAA